MRFMAEIEIHTAHEHENDPTARRVGVLVGIIGIVLAVVTIASHREHTAAVVHKAEANDHWSYYQAKKIREHTSEVGKELVLALGADPAKSEAAAAKFEQERAKYLADAEEIRKKGEAQDAALERAEQKALRYDLGEGALELGLVLSSLYFLGRQKAFPIAGALSAAVGTIVGLLGFLY
jgi:hypothetical protein